MARGVVATETEWQFDALDLRPVERFLDQLAARARADGGCLLPVAKPPRRLRDVYLDTRDWRVGRAGRSLRIRRVGRRAEATLKNLVDAPKGLRERDELTEPLSSDSLPQKEPGVVSDRVRALCGRATVAPVLEVRTRRRPFALMLDGREVAELALDETSITAPTLRTPLRLRRVEIELAAGAAGLVGDLARELAGVCHLQPAGLSKFEAGLLAAGTPIPGAVELGPVRVDETSTLAELAFAVLRRDLATMRAREPGTRLGEDPEDLHQMRVATRRMRAALTMFADVLPARAGQLQGEVRWLAGELGAVRDLDVQLAQLEAWKKESTPADEAGLGELSASLAMAREAARASLLAELDGRRYERVASGLTQMLARNAPRRTARCRTLSVIALPELLEARERRANKAARRARRSGHPEDFHRLRIRCKQLRYALEFAADCYRGATKPFAKVLSSLQDSLGEVQDAEVAAGWLRDVALAGAGEFSFEAVFAIGGIAERYRRESERLQGQLARRVGAVSGPEWRRLDSLLQKRRAEALAASMARRPLHRLAPAGGTDEAAADGEAPLVRLEVLAGADGRRDPGQSPPVTPRSGG